MQKILLIVLMIHICFGQQQFSQDCNQAPTPSLRETCLNLQRMAVNSRRQFQQEADNNVWPPAVAEHLRPAPVEPDARGQIASHPYDCMTLTCLCPYFFGTIGPQNTCIMQNGQPLTMAFRKEYRMLTDDERNRWHNALIEIKRNGEYDRMGFEHQTVGIGSGAHSGPGFLPWHREYLKRFEIALRLVDPSVSIPYWDSVLDNYLPDPRDSILFSPLFAGETDWWGNVVNGPFAYWSTLDGRSAILRELAQEGALFSEFAISQVMDQTNIEYILAYTAPLIGCPYPVNFGAVEYSHSNVHLWVGGHMKPPESSSNDPLFYTLHSFVDFIWELWRQLRQPNWSRESAYPPDLPQCADPQHFSYASMRPYYNLINRDGLSNMYTDQMYRYAPRPGCSIELPTCGSQYLFCDTRGTPHCVSKIKVNGNCFGFEGFDACFNGICVLGRCVLGPTPTPFVPTTPSPPPVRTQTPRSIQVFRNCFNRDPCCEQWGRDGECSRNSNYMRRFCPAACNICRPTYSTNNECADRHISCKQWGSQGFCRGNSEQFMQENCRTTCNLCNRPKNAQCLKSVQI